MVVKNVNNEYQRIRFYHRNKWYQKNKNGKWERPMGQMNGIFHKPCLDAISLSKFETVVDEFQEIYGNSQINR